MAGDRKFTIKYLLEATSDGGLKKTFEFKALDSYLINFLKHKLFSSPGSPFRAFIFKLVLMKQLCKGYCRLLWKYKDATIVI